MRAVLQAVVREQVEEEQAVAVAQVVVVVVVGGGAGAVAAWKKTSLRTVETSFWLKDLWRMSRFSKSGTRMKTSR